MVRRTLNLPMNTVFPQSTALSTLKKLRTVPRRAASIAAGTMLFTLGSPLHAHAADASLATAPSPSVQSQLAQYQPRNPVPTRRLPRQVGDRVRQDVIQRTGLSPQHVRISRYERHTWPDGCLGLAGPNEFCTQALVSGWRVQVSDGSRCWIYRTDLSGQNIRLEGDPIVGDEPISDELSRTLSDRILQVAASDTGISTSRLRISEAQPRVWNGCLGLDPGDGACTMIAISGWQVVVSSSQGSWIYHTDGNGNDIRLNETASIGSRTLVPQLMGEDELPAVPSQNIVFRSIQQGGIGGSVNEIRLLRDGRVVQIVNDRGSFTQIEINRVSQRQIAEFEQLLEDVRFGSLDRIDYTTPQGADGFTVTLTGRASTTRYADLTPDQLPSALRQVIQAWDQIAITG
jgi:hypothetical protein